MATTRIIPLHAGKGRTVGKAISDIIDYVKNPEKTDHGRFITSYQCDSRVADAQFLLDKQTYTSYVDKDNGTAVVAVENHKGFSLPATGGAGIALFLIVGVAGILTVSVVITKKTKKSC